MPNQKTLIKILQNYIQNGEEIEDVKHELKQKCKPHGGVAAYESIQSTTPEYKAILTELLNALSIGGSQIHFMPANTAKRSGYFNCYVWTGNGLFYIDQYKNMSPSLVGPSKIELFAKSMDSLKANQTQSTLHLNAAQIHQFITLNTESEHIPPTTDLELIESYLDSPNLYIALTRIKRKHRHLEQLVELINDVKPEREWLRYLLPAAAIAALAGAVYYLKEHIDLLKAWFDRTMPIISQWLGQTVHIIRNTPLIGIVSNLIPLIHAWYRMLFVDTPRTDWDPAIKLFFKTIEHSFPIVGYVLCYLAAGSMTVPALTMFVTGAGIEIVHTIYTVIQDQWERRYHPAAPGTEYFSQSHAARADNIYERDLWMSLTKFIANVLATTIVIIWCVYPPSMGIALACVFGAWLVDVVKSATLSRIKTSYADALQASLKAISTAYGLHQDGPQPALSAASAQEMEQKLRTLQQERQTFSEKLLASYKEGYGQGYRDAHLAHPIESEPTNRYLLQTNGMFGNKLNTSKNPDESQTTAANEETKTDVLYSIVNNQ